MTVFLVMTGISSSLVKANRGVVVNELEGDTP